MTAANVILFDALGTLLVLEPPAPRLRSELGRRLQIQISAEQADHAIAAEIAYYRAHLDEGRDARSLASLRVRCARSLRAALPPSERLDAVGEEELTKALLASLRFDAFPDVRPALNAARSDGTRLLVLSNWDFSLHEVLTRLGLSDLFNAVLTSAEVGARKPAPAIFERALALAGASADQALHVGDSPEEDVQGARAAGITPVLLRRGGGAGLPGVRTITTLAELA